MSFFTRSFGSLKNLFAAKKPMSRAQGFHARKRSPLSGSSGFQGSQQFNSPRYFSDKTQPIYSKDAYVRIGKLRDIGQNNWTHKQAGEYASLSLGLDLAELFAKHSASNDAKRQPSNANSGFDSPSTLPAAARAKQPAKKMPQHATVSSGNTDLEGSQYRANKGSSRASITNTPKPVSAASSSITTTASKNSATTAQKEQPIAAKNSHENQPQRIAENNIDEAFESSKRIWTDRVDNMAKPNTWGTNVEIRAASQIWKKNFKYINMVGDYPNKAKVQDTHIHTITNDFAGQDNNLYLIMYSRQDPQTGKLMTYHYDALVGDGRDLEKVKWNQEMVENFKVSATDNGACLFSSIGILVGETETDVRKKIVEWERTHGMIFTGDFNSFTLAEEARFSE